MPRSSCRRSIRRLHIAGHAEDGEVLSEIEQETLDVADATSAREGNEISSGFSSRGGTIDGTDIIARCIAPDGDFQPVEQPAR
jgi:hypothetical protein